MGVMHACTYVRTCMHVDSMMCEFGCNWLQGYSVKEYLKYCNRIQYSPYGTCTAKEVNECVAWGCYIVK